MTDDSILLEQDKKGSWLGFFIKLLAFLGVFLVVILLVLASLGGDSDVLKETAEDFIGNKLNGSAKIEKLHAITFFPYLSADIENVTVYETPSHERQKASVDRLQIAFEFWDIAFSTGKVRTLNVENFRSKAGALTKQPLAIEQIAIIDEGKEAYLKGAGKISGVPFDFKADAVIHGSGKSRKYSFSDIKPFEASFGNISFSGKIENHAGASVHFQDLKIAAQEPLLESDLRIFWSGTQDIGLKGDIKIGKTIIQPDLKMSLPEDGADISGEILVSEFHLNDVDKINRLIKVNDLIFKVLGKDKKKKPEGFDLGKTGLDLTIDFKDIKQNDVSVLAFKTPLTIKNGKLELGPFDNKYKGSVITGELVFDTVKKPAILNVNVRINDWDYKTLQQAFLKMEAIKGSGDLVLDIESKGNNTTELKENVNGGFSLITAQAELPTRMLNIWGGGLINAMLPELDKQANTHINCFIADFGVENGVAKSNALFLDAKRVLVQGEGEYDVVKDELDIELKPKTKSISLGDISSEVSISGSISSPDISPSALGLLKKIGGLTLGLVNPAFLAYSLTDLGLGNNHPCREFIGEGESKKQVKQDKGNQDTNKNIENSEEEE